MLRKNARFIMVMSIVLAGAAFASDSLKIHGAKSPTTGVLISVGATLAPVGVGLLTNNNSFGYVGEYLFFLGPALGPSAGHFYAHQWGYGCLGIGSRLALAGAALWFALPYISNENWDISATIFWVGVGFIALESIMEISSVPGSVRKYNEWLTKKNQINLMPEINFHKRSYGFKVGYSF